MSNQSISNNKQRIAKNTLLLYIRMLFIIIIGLYTSRVVLNTLGVSDYGIYNVVGGIVSMLAFLNIAMTQASQRFISFELGTGNLARLKEIFCTSVNIHLAIAGIIFIIAETVGLWFLNNHMNIAESRMTAANWVYQCSIFTFLLTIISVPYNACIVAHEHMKAFAYISILEAFLKLAAILLLTVVNYDKLILYALFILTIAFVIRIIYGIYCKRKFRECTYYLVFNKILFKEMFTFAGWSLIGNLGFSFKDQGSNIILNLFHGTTLNAARGIACQVNSIISNFSNNFIMALSPQIIKQYASGNVKDSMQLVYAGCRYSFFLLAVISIPIMINLNYILELWLGIVPQYTSIFLFCALISALINSMASPLVDALQATGKIKVFQIVICIIMISELPLTYLILGLGYPPYYIMIPNILVTCIGLVARIVLLKNLIPLYSIKYFILNICLKCILIGALCFLASLWVQKLFETGFLNFLLASISSFIITLSFIYIGGITSTERRIINNKAKNIIKKTTTIHKNNTK